MTKTTTYLSNHYGSAEVIKIEGINAVVKFLDTNNIQTVSRSALYNGSFVDYVERDRRKQEVEDFKAAKRAEKEAKRQAKLAEREGKQRRQHDFSHWIGQVLDSNNSGPFEILEVERYDEITIKFLNTGNVRITNLGAAKKGSVKDKV